MAKSKRGHVSYLSDPVDHEAAEVQVAMVSKREQATRRSHPNETITERASEACAEVPCSPSSGGEERSLTSSMYIYS